MRVLVWNQEKVDIYSHGLTKGHDESDFEFLQRVESRGSISSVINVNDEAQIEEIIEATHNETDVELKYQVIDENGNPIIKEPEQLACDECGEAMAIESNGVANHIDEDGNIVHDSDADHTPYMRDTE